MRIRDIKLLHTRAYVHHDGLKKFLSLLERVVNAIITRFVSPFECPIDRVCSCHDACTSKFPKPPACSQPLPHMQPLPQPTSLQHDQTGLPYDAHSPQSTGSPEPPAGILSDAEAKLWELVLAIHSVQTRFNRPIANGNGVSGAPSHQQLMLAEPMCARFS